MKIRKANKKDLFQMVQLMINEFSKPPYNDKWTISSARESILEGMEKGVAYICIDKRKIIGFIEVTKEPYHKPIAIIDNLIVDSSYQRRGIGKLLIKKIEEIYRKKGFLMLYTMTHRKAPAVKFYKKLGYKEGKNYITLIKKLK
jgi:ribosomal protein S18 acetylase RimI-like enzyme